MNTFTFFISAISDLISKNKKPQSEFLIGAFNRLKENLD